MTDEKLSKLDVGYDLANYDNIIDNIFEKLNSALNLILSKKKLFSAEDFSVYIYDEYTLGTNNDIYAPINIYICLNKSNNVKKLETKYSNTEAPILHYELDKLRTELYDIIEHFFEDVYEITKDKYGIKISSNKHFKELNAQGITYYIRPCIAYKNKDNIDGVIFYTPNRKYIDIDYPLIAGQNFINKVNATNGLLISYIRIFKNLYMTYYKVEDLPFEMFETLFYNVPTEYYKDLSFKTGREIMEYLLNIDIKTLKTIDEQDLQFNSKYKSLSRLYASRLIRTMHKLMCNPDHKVFDQAIKRLEQD